MRSSTPVLVGFSQLSQRLDDPAEAKSPLACMEAAIRAAAADTGVSSILERVQSVRVVRGIWNYRNPARHLADALDLGAVHTGLSALGGNHVQLMVNQAAAEIEAGDLDAVVLTGAECGRTIGQMQKSGRSPEWLEDWDAEREPDATDPDLVIGDQRWTRHEAEMRRGIQLPLHYYAIFETALRAAAGESPAQHMRRIARLWSGFSSVAAHNPHAWLQREHSAEEIATISGSNRAVTFPYPKLMNANMRVDMGAALILCSAKVADELGIEAERRIYPWVGTDATDHFFVSERDSLCSSPAIRIAGQRALELAEVETSDLDFLDIYSCFPSAVQVATKELGLPDHGLRGQPAPTVTGGLTFFGGPLNNYVMHSIARTAELLRAHRSSGASRGRALVTANGGMLTKHSFGVYSTEPSEVPFRHEAGGLQARVDALPRRSVVLDHRGEATIEGYCVVYGPASSARPSTSYNQMYGKGTSARSGTVEMHEPSIAHFALLLDDGSRTWANLDDRDALQSLCEEEFVGRRVLVDADRATLVS